MLNRVLVDVLSEYPLPIAEQNSLIELFALTGAQKYYQKPDIPYLIPELQRSWRSSKPKISLSGALQKHFHVRRTEQGLEIRKTSLWEEEPTLTLRFPDGYTLEVGSLRNPDAVKQEQYYGGSYQTTTTQLINEQLKKHLGTGIELELSLEKSLYNQTGEYLGEEKEIYLTLHFDKIAYADFGFEPSLCFQYTCFDPQTPIQHYKHRYYQYQNFPEREYQRHLLYNPNLQVMLSWEGLYGGGKCSWEHLGALHFRGSTQSFCSSTTLKQQMLQGKEKLHFPQELTFFGEKYQLQDLEMLIDYDLDARNDFGFTKRYDKPFANAEEAEQFISQEIQEKMLIYNTYLLSFADAPQIKLQYSNPRFSENPQALYFSQAEFQLNQSGELMSLPQTRKLYCDLRLEDRTETICGKRKREQPKTLEWMMIFEQEKEKRIDRSSAKNSREREMIFNASLLPLFRLQKTNIPHYYFIFPAE